MMTLEQLQAIMPRLPDAKAAEYLPYLNSAMEERNISCELCVRCSNPKRDASAETGCWCEGNTPTHEHHPARIAAFLAQLALESGELRWWEELPHRKPIASCKLCQRLGKGHPAGAQYEGREDLGNTRPGDGERFKGRGPIQLTGRTNYRAASLALFPDVWACASGKCAPEESAGRPERCGVCGGGDIVTLLEADPQTVLLPLTGFRVAAWFWASRLVRRSDRRSEDLTLNQLADDADAQLREEPSRPMERSYFQDITRAINGGLGHADRRWNYYLRAREALGLGAA